jgi:hypothetical protein
MGKQKKDKVGKALRDNPTTGGTRSSLPEQIHSDRFVNDGEKESSKVDAEGVVGDQASADPEVCILN